ncbi:MAG TPA: Crp/Fnr family transcriptional regulator [bacterium]|nr:Crp/Fnr family transcriptional regulator [bacterium]HMZ04345.1 Crp/Fnr family transcriptional regulator [bacterium]HNB08360.1 Crp/Fnr family transcriptional regulator [bacterium]HNB56643.1 Crp/Fnr family transcriptional regulator [bacterium]HND78348.1 Crp/Fnr family transcriptional regulator [bacterium]
MNFESIVESVSRSVQLNREEIEYFTSLLECKVVKKKNFLLMTGDICLYDYFVVSGCFKVCYSDDTGTEFIVKFALENWWVVDLESFINQTPSFFYIQAIEDSKVLQLSRSNYDKLLRKIPAFHKFSNERWQNGFIALQHRIMHDQSMTAEERYRRFKEKYPTLEQRIPQKLIAAYLGITSEFLSMIRKKILIS